MTDEEIIQRPIEAEDFEALTGKRFRVRLEGDVELNLKLDSVEKFRPIKSSKRKLREQPFGLTFLGSADVTLENALYHLTPEGGDPFILYLDKKDLDEESNLIEYETIIN